MFTPAHGRGCEETLLTLAGPTRLAAGAHRRKDDGKRLLRVVGRRALGALLDEACLPANLRGDLVVRQAGRGEERDLLPTRDRVHAVDGRDARLDHLLGVGADLRVDGLALDVEVLLGEHAGALVDGLAGAVEDAAEHVLRHGRGEDVARELDRRPLVVDARGALEHLHHRLRAGDLEETGRAGG